MTISKLAFLALLFFTGNLVGFSQTDTTGTHKGKPIIRYLVILIIMQLKVHKKNMDFGLVVPILDMIINSIIIFQVK